MTAQQEEQIPTSSWQPLSHHPATMRLQRRLGQYPLASRAGRMSSTDSSMLLCACQDQSCSSVMEGEDESASGCPGCSPASPHLICCSQQSRSHATVDRGCSRHRWTQPTGSAAFPLHCQPLSQAEDDLLSTHLLRRPCSQPSKVEYG